MKRTTGSEIRIRAATSADVAGIEACVKAAYQPYVARIGSPPGPMLEDYRQVVARHEVHVVECEQEIIGLLVLARTEEGFLLDNVAVSPNHHGLGIGRRLLELAEQRAQSEGFESIYLYTHETMTENQALYAKIGYVEYDRRREKGLARVYMRKRLA